MYEGNNRNGFRNGRGEGGLLSSLSKAQWSFSILEFICTPGKELDTSGRNAAARPAHVTRTVEPQVTRPYRRDHKEGEKFSQKNYPPTSLWDSSSLRRRCLLLCGKAEVSLSLDDVRSLSRLPGSRAKR